MPFKFGLKQKVAISTSGEAGEVIGRAEYLNSESSYWLRYQAANGGAEESWWAESALLSNEQDDLDAAGTQQSMAALNLSSSG